MVTTLLLLALGIAAGVGGWAAWTGRWRSWADMFPLGQFAVPFALYPLIGVWLPILALRDLGVSWIGLDILGGVALALTLPGLVVGWVTPRWFGPAWFHERRELRRRAPHPRNGLGLMIHAASRPRRPEPPDRPLSRWNATWVRGDDETGEKEGLIRPWTVEGHLFVHRDRLRFRSHALFEEAGGDETELVVPAADVRRARVVGAGAGPDGERRAASTLRSAFPRLVVDTADGPLLFEVQSAKRKAARIEEVLGREVAVP